MNGSTLPEAESSNQGSVKEKEMTRLNISEDKTKLPLFALHWLSFRKSMLFEQFLSISKVRVLPHTIPND